MSAGGPLFTLRWKGAICPCLEKGEDSGARKGLELLSGLRVKWLRSGRDARSVGGMMSGWFASSGSVKTNADVVEAILEWMDGEKGPELQIKPQAASSESADGEITMKQSAGFMKKIALKQLDKVLMQEESYIILQSEKENGKMQDLATIEIMSGNNNTAAQVKEAFVQLLEWDGRRLAAIPEEDRELDEEVGLKRKAQKAAHFAKREIELQKTKRSREKRKAALVKESGGLKYTAVAMANRAMEG